MKSVHKLVVVGLILTLFACEDKKTSTMTSMVSAADNPTSGVALSNQFVDSVFNTGCDDCKVTFAPSSLKVTIKNVVLCGSIVAGEVSGTVGCQSVNDNVVVPVNTEFQLVGQTAFADLGQFSVEVKEEQFGTFGGVIVNHEDSVTVSSDVVVGDTTYSVDDV